MNTRGSFPLFLVLGSLSLGACTSTDNDNITDFKRMNSAELAAYNRDADFWDQVHCVNEVRTGSHIRRRHCSTLYEIYTQVESSASEVSVLSSAVIY